jgi:hypothetical protein
MSDTTPNSETLGLGVQSRRQFLRGVGGLSLAALATGEKALGQPGGNNGKEFVLENDVLRIALSQMDGSLSVLDKRIGLVWRQRVKPGFRVASEGASATATVLSATVIGVGGPFAVTLTFPQECPHAFELLLEMPGRRYTVFPGYPFPFAAPDAGWHYVQNTTGEGMLMPLDKPGEIQSPFGWGGGQPWWGITDLNRAMRARLETFRLPGPGDETVYASPLRINYAFFTGGGYVGLAKDYRRDFLSAHPEMRPLQERTKDRPAVSHLKDGVYVYLWGENPAEDLAVVTEMKAAGVERGIAVFYGRHEMDRATCDGIKQLGWVMGKYQMPTGNLFQVSRKHHWPEAVLTGKLAPDQIFDGSNRRSWDRICGKYVLQEWPAKARSAIDEYGVQLFYFDTLVVQLAPCLSPDHPSTIEENQHARRDIMRRTREMGMLVGSGEGGCPTWALPDVDFFEGLMSLRTYSDNALKIPGGDYETDLGQGYREQAATQLDETRRIPLYQLAFHDFVGGTWVWRDTNYQSTPYAWKKDLFNILYGTMPMWHINRKLWTSHKTEMLASYQNITSVRRRIGFAEMTGHGWLSKDRSVQYTDWATGDRVIVNFGNHPYEAKSAKQVPPHSFVMENT